MKTDEEENSEFVQTSEDTNDSGKKGMNSLVKSRTKASSLLMTRQHDDDNDGSISMSKQLKIKRRKGQQPKQENPFRIGCAMPSKADLKKMFESSDEENNIPAETLPKRRKVTRSVKKKSEGIEHLLQTGVSMPPHSELKKMFADSEDEKDSANPFLLSPETIKTITSKAIDIIKNKPDDLIEEIIDPKLPVVPQKRRRKPIVPHIVSATEKLEILGFNARVGVGDVKYGVDRNAQNDPESPEKKTKHRKRKAMGKTANKKNIKPKHNTRIDIHFEEDIKIDEPVKNDITINVVDDKLDEPVEDNVKYHPPVEEDAKSDDSTKTESYDLNSYPTGFSPIPSTSKDSDIFQKNDLLLESSIMETMNDDVEIIETPYETITIIDDNDSPKITEIGHLETFPEVIIDTDSNTEIEILNDIPIPAYSSYSDFSNLLHDINNYSNDNCEIIDVDSIIAENNSVIEKFNRKKSAKKTRTIDLVNQETIICIDDNNDVEMVDISQDNNYNVSQINSNEQQIATNSKPNQIEQIVSNFFKTYNQTHSFKHQEKNLINKQTLGSLFSNILTVITSAMQTAVSYVSSALPSSNFGDNFDPQNKSTQNLQLNSTPIQVYNPHTYPYSRYLDPVSNINNPPLFSNNIPTIQPPHFNNNSQQNLYGYKQSNNPGNSYIQTCNSLQLSFNNQAFSTNTCHMINTLNVHETSAQGRAKRVSTQVQHAVPAISPESPKPAGRSLGDCPICMESLANKPIASTICGHIFCMPCLQAVVKTVGGKKCPTCRKPFKKGSNYHQIFL